MTRRWLGRALVGSVVVGILFGYCLAHCQQPAPAPLISAYETQMLYAQLPPVPSGSAFIVGSPGPGTAFYWVIAKFNTGASTPTRIEADFVPNVLSGANLVRLNWSTPSTNVPSGTTITYDVLKTTTNQLPNGTATIALATALAVTTVDDTGQALASYTVNTLPPNSIGLDQFPNGFILFTSPVPALSPATAGRVFYDATVPCFKQSLSGAPYVCIGAGGAGGSVTSFSAGNLSPLFTTTVTNPNTTPNLSFTQISQAQNLVFASPNGAAGLPTFRALVFADLPPGTGTVTSVGLALPVSVFSISGSPVTTTGTLTGAFINQTANTVFAGPLGGGPAVPTFRALVAADLPPGTGTVTTFSAGNLSPLFTTSVATPTTTPSLSFAQISQAQNLVFASPNGAAGLPTFRALVIADLPPGTCTGGLTTNALIKSTGSTCVSSTVLDDGTNPVQSPDGLTSILGPYADQLTNANPATTVTNETVCYNASGQAIICPTTQRVGIAGTAVQGAGVNSGPLQVCWKRCQQIYDNQTVVDDVAIASTTAAGQLHDTGSTSEVVGVQNMYVRTANAGAGTTALTDFLSPDQVAGTTAVKAPITLTVPNEGVTGTTRDKAAFGVANYIGGTITAKIMPTGSNNNGAFLGICIKNCGTTGNATIQYKGPVLWVADGATTAGDCAIPSTTVAGDFHDTGSRTLPAYSSGPCRGIVETTNGAGGTYTVDLADLGYDLDNTPAGPWPGTGARAASFYSGQAGQTSAGGFWTNGSPGNFDVFTFGQYSAAGLTPTTGNTFMELRPGNSALSTYMRIIAPSGTTNAFNDVLLSSASDGSMCTDLISLGLLEFGTNACLNALTTGSTPGITYQMSATVGGNVQLQKLNTGGTNQTSDMATTDQFGAVGVLVTNTSALLTPLGITRVNWDGAMTINDIGIPSTTASGQLHDIGTDWPCTSGSSGCGQVVGRAMQTSAAGQRQTLLNVETRGGPYGLANKNSTGLTTAQASFLTTTVGAVDQDFLLSMYAGCTGAASSVTLTVAYTDAQTNSAVTFNNAAISCPASTARADAAVFRVRAKTATTITFSSTITGSPTYTFSASIDRR